MRKTGCWAPGGWAGRDATVAAGLKKNMGIFVTLRGADKMAK